MYFSLPKYLKCILKVKYFGQIQSFAFFLSHLLLKGSYHSVIRFFESSSAFEYTDNGKNIQLYVFRWRDKKEKEVGDKHI